jgi:hypothetical protein
MSWPSVASARRGSGFDPARRMRHALRSSRKKELAMPLVPSLRKNASFVAIMFAIAVTALALVVATISLLVRM